MTVPPTPNPTPQNTHTLQQRAMTVYRANSLLPFLKDDALRAPFLAHLQKPGADTFSACLRSHQACAEAYGVPSYVPCLRASHMGGPPTPTLHPRLYRAAVWLHTTQRAGALTSKHRPSCTGQLRNPRQNALAKSQLHLGRERTG